MKLQLKDGFVCIILEKSKSEAFMSTDGAAVAQITKEDFDLALADYLTASADSVVQSDDRDMEMVG